MAQATEAKLIAELCRNSFEDFVREFWSTVVPEKLKWNWHMTYLCREIQTIYERIFRDEKKLYDEVVNISPGTTKSTIFSVMSTPWAWTRMPNFKFIGASFHYDLARILSNKSRDVVKSDLYQACFPEIKIRDDQDSKGHFANTKGGMRYSVGSQGGVMGMHGHVIGIDDPVDPKKVASETELNNINNWIKDELSTRKVDKQVSVIFMIMQRLHQDDPTAQKILEKRVRHIKIPATLEFEVKPKELSQFYIDGLMDPVRMPLDFLDEERQRLLEYGFAGQYGQNPVPAGGGMFKTDMIRWGRPPDHFKRVVRFWDKAATPAGTKRKRIPFTVGVMMGEDFDERIWVLDVKRFRQDSFTREKTIHQCAIDDSKLVIVGVEQEPGSGGKDSAVATVKRLRGWRVRVLRAVGKKEIRADEFSVQVNAGQVYIPEKYRQGSSWTGWALNFVDELKHWPFSTYKDQGDAAGGAFTMLESTKRHVGVLPYRDKKKSGSRSQGILVRYS